MAGETTSRGTLLVTGAAGALGSAVLDAAASRDLPAVGLTHEQLDISEPPEVWAALHEHRPRWVVNAAGFVGVDDAEGEAVACDRANRLGTEVLARLCRQDGVRLAVISTDLVFDGALRRPYLENDPVHPLSAYGRSKAAAERVALELDPDALVVRTGPLLGPPGRPDFAWHVAMSLRRGVRVHAACDETVSPTWLPDLATALLDELLVGRRGILHLAGAEPWTWSRLAEEAAVAAGMDPAGIVPVAGSALGRAAPRPAWSVLGTRHTPLPGISSHFNEWAAGLVSGSTRR